MAICPRCLRGVVTDLSIPEYEPILCEECQKIEVGETIVVNFATQSGACAASDHYAAATRNFPRYVLRQAINATLQSFAQLPLQDTSLSTIAEQEAYTLPAGISNLKRV
jgi:hypothetical protein